MEESPLSPLPIRGIRLDGTALLPDVEGAVVAAPCPSYGELARRVHARYVRSPPGALGALPWRGFAVRLVVTVRRFRCDHPGCRRKTFAEDFGAALGRRSRFTADVRRYLQELSHALGARPGARLADRSGAPASHDTLLRLAHATAAPPSPAPRILGVADLALRRGCRSATPLVDLETRRPIELLEGRDAETVASWLRQHPGVEAIVRDRAGAYAEGASQGAPDASQIADPFHLTKSVTAAFEELLKQRRWETTGDGRVSPAAPSALPEEAAPAPAAPEERAPADKPVESASGDGAPAEPPPATAERGPPARPVSPTKQRDAAQRAAREGHPSAPGALGTPREARWRQVHELHAQGHGLRRIAVLLGLHRQTVRRLLDSPAPPRNHREHPRPGGIDSPKLRPFAAYLQQRWREGCTTVWQLHRELVERGDDGGSTLLNAALRSWRSPRPPRPPKPPRQKRHPRAPHSRRLRRLLTRPPEQLADEERAAVRGLLETDVLVDAAYALVQRFRTLLEERDAAALETWLADAQASAIPSLAGVANGMRADDAAVVAGVAGRWSNGPVEGRIHRIKLLKRQGYGRASFTLLRQRVLTA